MNVDITPTSQAPAPQSLRISRNLQPGRRENPSRLRETHSVHLAGCMSSTTTSRRLGFEEAARWCVLPARFGVHGSNFYGLSTHTLKSSIRQSWTAPEIRTTATTKTKPPRCARTACWGAEHCVSRENSFSLELEFGVPRSAVFKYYNFLVAGYLLCFPLACRLASHKPVLLVAQVLCGLLSARHLFLETADPAS